MIQDAHSIPSAVRVDDLSSSDVLLVLKARFQHERISQYFNVADGYEFAGSRIHVTPGNSLLLSFTAKADKGSRKPVPPVAYRLLFLLDLRRERDYRDELRIDLSDLSEKFNVDRTIVWSATSITSTVLRVLKRQSIEVVYITEEEWRRQNAIPFFLPLRQRSHEYDVAVNSAADLLIRRLKKLFHLVLSEVAAPIYDSLYGKERVATREMMAWEQEEVDRIAKHLCRLGRNRLAVDVGCGTGRHTFPLADSFAEVYAFDFSPRMIEQARDLKRRKDRQNIVFDTIDIEYEDVPIERVMSTKGEGRADLVLASFGMGSFIEDTMQLIRRFHGWLRPGGYALFSFYNAASLLMNVTPNWRDTSLSAHLDAENKTLRVELDTETVFHIFCQPYTQEVLAKIKAVFDVEGISTFPSIMALMPNSLLANDIAASVFRKVDRFLASEWNIRSLLSVMTRHSSSDEEVLGLLAQLENILVSEQPAQVGYYVLVVARKGGAEVDGHSRVLALLARQHAEYEIIEHPPVQSVRDVIREIGEFKGRMVKTVIFKHRPSKRLVAVVVLAERRVDKKAIAKSLGFTSGQFVYAPEKDVLRLGFPLGGLAPFGFSPGVEVDCFVDADIPKTRRQWLFCGAGDNTRTLKIRANDFKVLIADYQQIALNSAPPSDEEGEH